MLCSKSAVPAESCDNSRLFADSRHSPCSSSETAKFRRMARLSEETGDEFGQGLSQTLTRAYCIQCIEDLAGKTNREAE
jgi:hypothetical protein